MYERIHAGFHHRLSHYIIKLLCIHLLGTLADGFFGSAFYFVCQLLGAGIQVAKQDVAGMVAAGIVLSSRSKVRLLRPSDLSSNWDPETDTRLTAWEMVHHLIRVLEAGGEVAAAKLAAKLGSRAETARELCYHLYTVCERKKRAAEALSYNALVQSWPEIMRLAQQGGKPRTMQAQMFEQE